jgi:2-polyprenyl-3-methyl-5-hydroxy-6-metoxy-1,4-benzoquinol methylase
MKRVAIAELLDTDSGTPEEIASSIRDLRNINRWFGGISSNVAMLEEVAARLNVSRLSMLEVASGSGELSSLVANRLAQKGIQIQITLLDRVRSHLNGSSHGILGDALALPFADSSFDVVSSNLFVHHLAPEELFQFAQEGLRVCSSAFLINDLVRGPLHLALVYMGLPLFRSRLTWHDAPASVRQAYTPEEIRSLFSNLTSSVEIQHHYLFRMSIKLWKSHV